MHPGAIAAILIALGFTLFEIYTVKRSAYRMEPPYILQKYAAALHGVTLCGAPSESQMSAFNDNYAGVRRRARKSIQETHPNFGEAHVDASLQTLEKEAIAAATDIVAANGCDHTEARKLVRSFEMRSR